MTTTLILLAVAIACAWMSNRLLRDRHQVHVAWSDVDVQWQRRHDLLPVLAETVPGDAGHENELLSRIAREHNLAQSSWYRGTGVGRINSSNFASFGSGEASGVGSAIAAASVAPGSSSGFGGGSGGGGGGW